MVEMITITIDGTTYEVVDKKARQEKLDATALPEAVNQALALCDFVETEEFNLLKQDIEDALDAIIVIQNELIGGNNV